MWIKLFVILFWLTCLGFVVLAFGITACGEPNQYDLPSAAQFYRENPNISDIVVSLTTIPSRLHSDVLRATLDSILRQTKRAKAIQFYIPWHFIRNNEPYVIPEWLEILPITIIRCHDRGPATKYLNALEDGDPNQWFLICDDDTIKARDLIASYEIASNKFPECCIAAGGYDCGTPTTYYVGKTHLGFQITVAFSGTFGIEEERQVDIVTGWASYMVKPRMISLGDLANYESMPKAAFFVDDTVISGWLAKNNTKCMVVQGIMPAKLTYLDVWAYIVQAPGAALSQNENKALANDVVMEEFFANDWPSSKK